MSISETICLTELMLNSSPGSVWQSQLESKISSVRSEGSMQARQIYESDSRQTNTSTWLNLTQLSQQVIYSQKQFPSSSQASAGLISSSTVLHCSPIIRTLLRKSTNTLATTGYFFSPSSTPSQPSPISYKKSSKTRFILPLPSPVQSGCPFLGTTISKSGFSTISQIFWRYFWQSLSSHSQMVLSSWKQKMVQWACGSLLKSLIFRSSSSKFSSKKEGQRNAGVKSSPEMGLSQALSQLQRRFWRGLILRSIRNKIEYDEGL